MLKIKTTAEYICPMINICGASERDCAALWECEDCPAYDKDNPDWANCVDRLYKMIELNGITITAEPSINNGTDGEL